MKFENVVFAGGGNRCFWQAGFWLTIAPFLERAPDHIASVSAGAAISCALFSGRFDKVLDNTLSAMRSNRKNRYWENLLSKEPIHPHNTLYRNIIKQSIDAQGLEQLKQGPVNHILVAHIPRWLGPRTAALLGIAAYQLEKRLFEPVHPSFGRKLGFCSEFIHVQQCQNIEQLTELILSSSCTPPFTPIMYQNGQAVLDGGMVDNIPVHGVKHFPGQTLVLCSRPYRHFPVSSRCLYVAPSRPVPVESWDYTNPDGVIACYNQGKVDALAFLDAHKL
jgi:predicted acylesterase/phospholipase RssA